MKPPLINMNINYIRFEKIDSTHLWAKQNIELFKEDQLTCIVTEEQSAGIGRFKRPWISPKGNIAATLYFTLKKECPFLLHLAQLLSLSCATLLKNEGFQPTIKWPNDLLLAGKKTAGILCEVISLEKKEGIILSIGLNVNMEEAELAQIDQPATSLWQISGRTWKQDQLLEALLVQFLADLERIEKEGVPPFLEKYKLYCPHLGSDK